MSGLNFALWAFGCFVVLIIAATLVAFVVVVRGYYASLAERERIKAEGQAIRDRIDRGVRPAGERFRP